MEIKDAEALIQKAFVNKRTPETWADLGCGGGTFTYALSNCLVPGSRIYAVDKHRPTLVSTPHADIECIQADIRKISFRPSELDGILMANSIHFIREKSQLIQRMKLYLKKDGILLIVEYDREKGNLWVPFPLNYRDSIPLAQNAGFSSIERIGERNSRYGSQKIYAAVIK
jgi:ubiquinone/menaquinone biosynthesis C-methylase UbiE